MLNIGTGWILGLILCLIFIIWRNGLQVLIAAPAWNLKKWVACADCSAILHRLNFMVTTVFNFHNLKKWVACINCSTCLNNQWAQHWDWHPSVFQAGTAILNRLNFMVTTVFNFHNLKRLVACADCGACMNNQWVQQWDWHPSVFQAGAAILNRLNFFGWYCI